MHAVNIIHRDVKPGNLVVSKGRGYLQLIDFGLAEETMTGQHCSLHPHDDMFLPGIQALYLSKCIVPA